jgi:predicted nuclease of predicted toxin-antitoxin system
MRFLVDEDVPVKVIGFLRKLGHDTRRVTSGLKNGAVLRLAVEEKRLLITRDSDFTDTVRYPPSRCPGIIHLDIHPPYWEDISPVLKSLLAKVPAERFAGTLIVLRSDGFEELRRK